MKLLQFIMRLGFNSLVRWLFFELGSEHGASKRLGFVESSTYIHVLKIAKQIVKESLLCIMENTILKRQDLL